MNSHTNTTCPPTDTLHEFVQGKLQPPTLDECELHISDCPDCLETLRGLGTDDTLTGHIAAAMNEPDETRSSAQFNGLLERLLAHSPATNDRPSLNGPAELMADRAAEVLRCLEPSGDDFLGTIGDYDLERLIGAGSSGVVFKAIDRTLNRTVALKILRSVRWLGKDSLLKLNRRLRSNTRTSSRSIRLANRIVWRLWQCSGCLDKLWNNNC